MAKSKGWIAVERARTVLLISQPFFGCLALHLRMVEVTDPKMCDTMGVDGYNMYFYSPFVLGLTEPELIGVVAHEVMHCAYFHMTRRGQRQPLVWNIAGDFVINSDLKKANFVLPGKPISLATQPGIKGHLYDPKYDGMSTEEVYERVRQDVEQRIAKGIYVEGQDVGGCGGVSDAKGDGEGKDEGKDGPGAKEAIQREWEATVRMAVNTARANHAGKVPGYLERLVSALVKPKINWKDQTRQFIDQSMTKDYSWSRPNRRFASSGLILPGFIADSLNHLVMYIDISGSISNKLMTAMVSEGAGALADGVADLLSVIYIDTDIRHVDQYQRGDIVQAKTIGGGGTDFTRAFSWVKDNGADANCVIFLTDMETCGWGEEPHCPVLWGAYNTEARLASMKPPFGHIIHIESSN